MRGETPVNGFTHGKQNEKRMISKKCQKINQKQQYHKYRNKFLNKKKKHYMRFNLTFLLDLIHMKTEFKKKNFFFVFCGFVNRNLNLYTKKK